MRMRSSALMTFATGGEKRIVNAYTGVTVSQGEQAVGRQAERRGAVGGRLSVNIQCPEPAAEVQEQS